MRIVKTLVKQAYKPWYLLVFILLVFLAVRLNSDLRDLDSAAVIPPLDITQSVHPVAAKVLSFGHDPALVDSLLLRSLGDTQIDPVAPQTRAPIFYLLNLASELDPHYFELYWISASLLSIIYRDGVGTDILLNRAHKIIEKEDYPSESFRSRYWAYAWQLELMRGYNALSELQDLHKAQEAFTLASSLPGAPAFLSSLSQQLSTRKGRIEVALKTIQNLLERDNALPVQKMLEQKKQEATLAAFLDSTERQFLESRAASFSEFQKKQGLLADPFGGTLHWNTEKKSIETTTTARLPLALYP
ncbi:MAG: hypothetical protein KGQ59_11300 [Bdellovibrionales bacterium]|nr:hypothetical protein [Bdellovibrionales bacterium]